MANILNQDFTEFINALNQENVEYILVGGYAVIYHGYNRTTGDLDIWVHPTSENYTRIKRAFACFGMSLFDMTETKFLDAYNFDVFTFGRPPVCIEILTSVKGLSFINSFANSSISNFDGVEVRMIDLRDLLLAKTATNRAKDQDDIEHLTPTN